MYQRRVANVWRHSVYIEQAEQDPHLGDALLGTCIACERSIAFPRPEKLGSACGKVADHLPERSTFDTDGTLQFT